MNLTVIASLFLGIFQIIDNCIQESHVKILIQYSKVAIMFLVIGYAIGKADPNTEEK